MPNVITAGSVPIQLKESAKVKLPVNEAMLTTRSGMNTRNPLAALNPIPIKIVSNISMFIFQFQLNISIESLKNYDRQKIVTITDKNINKIAVISNDFKVMQKN
ncbi:MAG: hypothetical protein MZV64_61470 [Ignavibacteriales bacterium]|nr:hypothetical protein [Ignavibacteriales bacterium]